MDNMKKDPAVQRSYLTPEIHARFNKSSRNDEKDYDLEKY